MLVTYVSDSIIFEFVLKERWVLSEKKQNNSVSECVDVCVSLSVSVLDHFRIRVIVMRCHVQVINTDMFIT